MRSFRRYMGRLGLGLVVALGCYLIYITFLVGWDMRLDQAAPADAIVVLGAAQYNGHPSPVLKARLDHAADLWKRKLALTVVVTGGRVPGDTHTEAGASAAYLATRGVPDEHVLREVEGRTSWESLQATARFLHERGINKVILVSDPFHDARISAMAKAVGLNPLVSPTRTSPITGGARIPYVAKEIGALALGKLLGFSRVAGLERQFAS